MTPAGPTSPLDSRFGEGTLTDLRETFTPDGEDFYLRVTEYGPGVDIRLLFEWFKAGAPYAQGEIVWRTDEGEIVFVNLVVEEAERGKGFYKWIAGNWPWFRARGVTRFKAMAGEGATFLPAGGDWFPEHEREWRWNLPRS